METAPHSHTFSADEWPFSDPPNALTITSVRVIDGLPILLVTHDVDGDWQILCGTTNASDDGRVLCLGCAFQRDRSIGQLADLPLGWCAWRDELGAPWKRDLNASSADGN